MNTDFRLRRHLATNSAAHPEDVLAVKGFLQQSGLYDVPDWGMTPYPDQALFDGIKAFQGRHGLTGDGYMKPDGETEAVLRAQARALQGMGRYGDTLLAHISPKEAALLQRHGGAGTRNPQTGLLEFYDADKKQGKYIWRTQGDSKVRSAHAERDGKVFSWDDPPEGGHPGEAPNCRCRAEDVPDENNCTEVMVACENAKLAVEHAEKRLNEAQKDFEAKSAKADAATAQCDSSLVDAGVQTGVGAVEGAQKGGWWGAVFGGGASGSAAAVDAADKCLEAKPLFEAAMEARKTVFFWREQLAARQSEFSKAITRAEQAGCIGSG